MSQAEGIPPSPSNESVRRKSFSSLRSRVSRKKRTDTINTVTSTTNPESPADSPTELHPPSNSFLRRPSEESVQFASGNAAGIPSWNHSPSRRNLDLPNVATGSSSNQPSDTQPISILDSMKAICGLDSGSKLGSNHPVEPYLPLIARFLILTSVSSIVLSKFHWSLALAAIATGSHILWKQLESLGKDLKWEQDVERAEKESLSKGNLETAHWVNAALATIWPLINSEYFVPFADLLEDSLMQQVPGIVHGVRVEDMDQGSVPLKLQSFKILGDSEYDFLGTKPDEDGQEQKKNKRWSRAKGEEGQEEKLALGDEDELGSRFDTGDYVNLEVTFGYRVTSRKGGKTTKEGSNLPSATLPPPSTNQSGTPAESIHLLIYMAIGLQKLAAIEVPVWVEMLGIQGKMRLRLQVMPAAPFVKHVAFTFVESPQLEMAARPLGKKMVLNAMDLPLISTYVLNSVKDVIQGFISPKSYTVDVAGLLGAGDGPQDAYAIGIVCVVIQQATNLAASDVGGTSDPFTQVAFARAGKPLFTTKVCVKTKEPIWQETAYILVGPDEIRDHERLRLTVFDADRFSADDPLGKVELSLARLIRQSQDENGVNRSGKLLQSRTDKLQPMRRGGEVQGSLKYSVGFFHLHHPENAAPSPQRAAMLEEVTRRNDSAKAFKNIDSEKVSSGYQPVDSIDPREKGLPDYMTGFDRFVRSIGLPIDDAVLEARRQRDLRIAKLLTALEGAQAATSSPPDPAFPSGVLVFHIHSLDSLEVQTTQKSLKNVKHTDSKQRYSNDDGEGATTRLPSSYVQVFLNDEAIFRTRTKPLNARPYINGGSERFITDWTSSELCFVVKDSRMRENDPILGVVRVKLTDVFKQSSKSTEIYTITGGLGYGKIRLSLIFRSVELQVPKPLRGWGVGILELSSCRVFGVTPLDKQKSCHLMFETVGGRSETSNVEAIEEYDSGEGANATVEYQWPLKEPIRIPVRQRYPSFLYIHLRSESRIPGRHHSHAHTVIPLNRLADDAGYIRRVPIFETTDPTRFDQDMMKMMATTSQLASPNDTGPEDLPVLEDLCYQAEQHLPDELFTDGHIKRVGTLELSLVFQPGLSEDFRGLIHADHELRYGYEAYLAALDAGERPRANAAARARRRKESQLGERTEKGKEKEGSQLQNRETDRNLVNESENFQNEGPSQLRLDTSMIDAKRPPALPARKRTASLPEKFKSSSSSGQEDEDYDEEGDVTGMDYGEEDESSPFDDEDMTPEGRRARQRSLHRQHRGAAQLKGVRTLTWLKTNAQDGVGRLKKVTAAQSKKMGKMESEGVSHF